MTTSTATRTPSAQTPVGTGSHRTAWLLAGLVVATLAILGIGFAVYQATQSPQSPQAKTTPASTSSYDSGTTLQRSADDVAHGAGSVVVTGAGQPVR